MRNVHLGYLLAAVNSILVLLVAFGINLSDDQIAAILGAVNACGFAALALNDARLKRQAP